MKAHIQFWIFFFNVEVILWRAMIFWTKSHGPKRDDDEVKMKIFEKKSYTLFYLDLKYKTKTYIQF